MDFWRHPVFRESNLVADVLRLDKIHPEISGNKWFKLKYYLEKAKHTKKQGLISFGGAYSNHLLALAMTARIEGFSSIGLVRGEEPNKLSPTLIEAKGCGMELRFLSRRDYDHKKKSIDLLTGVANDQDLLNEIPPDYLLIPEGGVGIEGLRGAEEILGLVPNFKYSHICLAVGTGITLAGIINSAVPDQKIIGVSVLKGTRDFEPMDSYWVKNGRLENIQIVHDCHFGGYAKYTESLINFMNRNFAEYGIPTDFVYTGKLFFSVIRMATMKIFPPGSRILVLHTGGLQGNRSLLPGLLEF